MSLPGRSAIPPVEDTTLYQAALKEIQRLEAENADLRRRLGLPPARKVGDETAPTVFTHPAGHEIRALKPYRPCLRCGAPSTAGSRLCEPCLELRLQWIEDAQQEEECA